MHPQVKVFEAQTDSFWGVMNSHNTTAGFRVPEYQRMYNWKPEQQIKRLLEDCLNGFFYFSRSGDDKVDKYTFLATIILVPEKSKDSSSFGGTSLSIVDGQQRLTTLMLTCCALIQELRSLFCRTDLKDLNQMTVQWIKEEVEHVCDELFSCVISQVPIRGQIFRFPRIVRAEKDYRAATKKDSDYRSVVARFQMDFSEFYMGTALVSSGKKDAEAEEELFFQNYEYIKEQIRGISEDAGKSNSKRDIEYEQIPQKSFEQKPLRHLFKKINAIQGQDPNRVLSDIAKNSKSSGLIRLLLFSHYLMDRVILTRVETPDEASAFDVFDALNTTGEPLTAIETFKPLVIRFEEEEVSRYQGSDSEISFNKIEEYLKRYPEKQQTTTRDLLVTFALYLEGHKLSRDLTSQRAYLRNIYKGSSKERRKIVESLAHVAEFRKNHWNSDSIPNLTTTQGNEILKLCLKTISDMNTSMTLPVLTRYWVEFKHKDSLKFIESVKAVTAFLVLRRSVTGGTSGIDADFREIVKRDSWNRDDVSICIYYSQPDPNNPHKKYSVHDHSKSLPLPDPADLKTKLREMLERLDVQDKCTWVEKAAKQGLAKHSIALCRFLLFAASHHAEADQKTLGLLTRENVIPSDINNFLSFENWCDTKYATIEHIAPQSQKGTNWDKTIYQNQYIRDTIGNLTLLPKKENSMISDSSWEKKKLFYAALSSNSRKQREDFLSEAKKGGFRPSKISEDLIRSQVRLYMLSPLSEVREWDESFIRSRTKNILELVWDEIAPWLSY